MNLNQQLNKLIFKKHLRRLDESLLDVRQKNAKNLSDEQFKQLMNYDPIISQIPNLDDSTMASTNESYSRWLLKMLKNGSLQNAEPEVVRKLLQDFEVAKKRRNLLPNNDINFYKNIDDLQNALSNISQNLTINQKNKDAKKAQSVIKKELKPGMYLDGGAELLYLNDDWEVWTPHTYEGSKALRHGAVWCTGGDTPNFYNSYTEEGQLFVIINRHNKNEKYQLFVPFEDYDNRHEREFRDKNNDSVKFREFIHNNDLVDFFMTQDNVTNSYKDLDDPDIDDEWDEDKEEEIMNTYGLAYDDYGQICMYIDYDDILIKSYYTSWEDYRDMASYGYLENGIQGDWDQYISDVMTEDGFLMDISWENTDLKSLYEYFIKKSGLSQYSFNNFLETLFYGAAGYTESEKYNEEIGQWFDEKGGMWKKQVKNCISQSYLDTPYVDFVYKSLQNIGWNPPRVDYRNNNRAYESYLEYFRTSFMYMFEDCHSVEEFYNEIADNGHRSYYDVIDYYDIKITENKDDIYLGDCDWDNYSRENAESDAEQIIDVFLTTKEWNNFLNDLEEEATNPAFNIDNINVEIAEYRNELRFILNDDIELRIFKWLLNKELEYYKNNNDIEDDFIINIIHRLLNDYSKNSLINFLIDNNIVTKESVDEANRFKNYSMISNYYFDKVFFKPIKSIVEKYFKENSENEIKNHFHYDFTGEEYNFMNNGESLFYVNKKDMEKLRDEYKEKKSEYLSKIVKDIIDDEYLRTWTGGLKKELLKYGNLTNKEKDYLNTIDDKNEKIDSQFVYDHMTPFVEKILTDYLKEYFSKYSIDESLDESLFEPDW